MFTQQTFLFADPPRPRRTPQPRPDAAAPPPSDPNIDADDRPRAATQNAAILALLESRDMVSNAELAAVSLKYTGRISDLRAAGHVITIARRDGGTRYYRLERNAG